MNRSIEGSIKRPHRELGLTIVEIMVSLAIAAVLIGLALPAFNGMLAQRSLRSEANDFVLAVQVARSEATRRGQNVSVQAADDGDDTNEWGAGGWCVVLGNGGACPGTADELRTFGAIGNTFDGIDDLATLTFNSRGLLANAIDQVELQLCDPNEDIDPGRQITVTLIGRVSYNDLVCHP